jgi:hypothetical protein
MSDSIFHADVVVSGSDGEMRIVLVKEVGYLKFIKSILKILDKDQTAEVWTARTFNKKGDELGILWKVLVTLKDRRGIHFAQRVNKIYRNKIKRSKNG